MHELQRGTAPWAWLDAGGDHSNFLSSKEERQVRVSWDG